jgi:hypothetical protein
LVSKKKKKFYPQIQGVTGTMLLFMIGKLLVVLIIIRVMFILVGDLFSSTMN